MDLATFLGIFSALFLIIFSISSGGGLSLFINIPSLMIVVGGTIGVTLVNFSLRDVLGLTTIVKHAFFNRIPSSATLVPKFVEFASKARKDGILSLEESMEEINDPFMLNGLQLLIDGVEPETIEKLMETEIDHLRERHTLGAEILANMGAFAPAMGLIGTLLGLVQMLQSLDDPSTIGPSMAIALLTTFYGAMLANVVFLPLAGKLKNRSQEESLIKELVMEGILSISLGSNPRVVEQKLNAFLSPKIRVSSFQ
jgi:chemotaxis protein MotA